MNFVNVYHIYTETLPFIRVNVEALVTSAGYSLEINFTLVISSPGVTLMVDE